MTNSNELKLESRFPIKLIALSIWHYTRVYTLETLTPQKPNQPQRSSVITLVTACKMACKISAKNMTKNAILKNRKCYIFYSIIKKTICCISYMVNFGFGFVLRPLK